MGVVILLGAVAVGASACAVLAYVADKAAARLERRAGVELYDQAVDG